MIRFLDFLLSLLGLLFCLPILFCVLIICYFETKSPLFFQTRVGRFKKPFTIIKFRTMKKGTQSLGTHLINQDSITKLGKFLRRSKIDELPQLFNVLIGQMSIVGPRPNLFNQEELILERDLRNIYNYRPGITGLSQILEIDMSKPKELALKDAEMLKDLSLKTYLKIIFFTLRGKGMGDRIKNLN